MEPIERVALGRTGLRVSHVGLGCGGPSRLGRQAGASEAQSIEVVRRALDLGIDFFDTAEAYGTEPILGRALAGGARERAVISTKKIIVGPDGLIAADELARGVEASLRRLGTDRIDVFHLHGVLPDQYDWALGELRPALERLRERGLVRCVGISEMFIRDPGHAMLARAVRDEAWDVVMVGFNLLNQSARTRVLAETRARGIGTLDMFAVRRALSRPEKLLETVAALVRDGAVDAGVLDARDPLGFLVAEGVASSIPDAAYRFCRDEPGIDVVLTGTGSPEHLTENVRSLRAPPLPDAIRARLREVFARVDSESGN